MEEYPKFYLYRRIVEAKLFIDSRFHDPIDLNNIADEASFSKFHFIRLFKKIYHRTPYQYLIFVRIERAKNFLSEGMAVSQVCFDVGFESVSSFTGLFKKSVGVSPSVYRQQQLDRKAEIFSDPLKFIPNCFAEHSGWLKNSNFQEVI